MTTTRLSALALFVAVFTTANAQLDNFTTTLNSFFSEPEENGFMYFQTPNTYPVGACFQYYKGAHSDLDNDMILINTFHDDVMNMDHYKFQQVFKGVPVEGAGCIEHYDASGSLVFTNAKHAVNLNFDISPKIEQNLAVSVFMMNTDPTINWAWLDAQAEADLKVDLDDPNISYFPDAELILALDTLDSLQFNIDGSRYRLAYRIHATSLNPYSSKYYFMDANSGVIFRTLETSHTDGPAFVQNYGIQTIDTQWGGSVTEYYLKTDANSRNIHTKKKDNVVEEIVWWSTSNTTDDNDQWPQAKYVETSAHYFTSITWDHFKDRRGWNGMDSQGAEVRVRTHWQANNAKNNLIHVNSHIHMLNFGSTPTTGDHYGTEPSVVAHEFMHGVTFYSAGLLYQNESGALNEAFSDIFGIVVQGMELDNDFTDWIIGNSIQNGAQRSLEDPKSNGVHFDANGNQVLGQPDTYQGDYWYAGNLDNGGVHVNSGVANKWFYLLTEGGSGVNDNSDFYQVQGIGMDAASDIAFVSLATTLMNSSQYADARMASVTIAEIIYGECSIEYQSTKNAWYAVGVGPEDDCTYTLGEDDHDVMIDKFLVFPNPSDSYIMISVPDIDDNYSLNIHDVSGKLIYQGNPDAFQTNIDVSKFDSGLYVITYISKSLKLTKKFIKN